MAKTQVTKGKVTKEDRLRTKCGLLERDLNALHVHHTNAQKERDHNGRVATKLKKERDSWEKSHTQLKATYGHLVNKNNGMVDANELLKTQNASMEKACKAKDDEIMALDEMYQNVAVRNDALETKNRHVSSNLFSIALQATATRELMQYPRADGSTGSSVLSCPVWDAFNAQRVQKVRDYHVYKEKTNVCEDEESTSTEDGDAESPGNWSYAEHVPVRDRRRPHAREAALLPERALLQFARAEPDPTSLLC